MSIPGSSSIFHPVSVSAPGVRPATVLTLNSAFSSATQPLLRIMAEVLAYLNPPSSIIIPMLSAPVAAFVCMLGLSSGTGGRWARWHRQVGEAQRKTMAAHGEWGFLTGRGAAPITWIVQSTLFLGTSVEWVCLWVCVIMSVCFSPTSVFLSLLFFQEQIKIHLDIKVFLEGSGPRDLRQSEYRVI